MKVKETKYYLSESGIVAKRSYDWYLFKETKWEYDRHYTFYRALEDKETELGMIKEISFEEAMKRIAEQCLNHLSKEWKTRYPEKAEKWRGWPAKLVETRFILYGQHYSIDTSDIGVNGDCWGQGFMELVQKELEEDLKAVGAVNIYHDGFAD